MIVGEASTSRTNFLPLPTPNLPFSRNSSATGGGPEADEKPRRRPRRGSRRNQREDVAEEKIELCSQLVGPLVGEI